MATPASTRLIVPAAFWIGLTAALLALWLSGQGARAWEVVREARWAVLPLVVLLGIALPVIHAIRWRIVMRTLGTDISPLMAADMTVSASLVNYASPGYLGAPAMAFMANRTAGAPWSRSLLSLGRWRSRYSRLSAPASGPRTVHSWPGSPSLCMSVSRWIGAR